MLEMSQQLIIGPSEYDEHPAIPTILVLIRLSRWTDPIFAFPCTLQPAAEGPSSALSSRPCDISWAHLSGLPKRWHFLAASPAKASKAHYCTPGWWNGGWSWLDCCDGQHLSRARILISDVMWLSFSAATHHQMGKLYPLSEPSVCRFGKPAFTNWEAFTNGESQNHSSMGPSTFPLDVDGLRLKPRQINSVIRWNRWKSACNSM